MVPTKLMNKGAREDTRTKADIDHCPHQISELSAYTLRAENTTCMVNRCTRESRIVWKQVLTSPWKILKNSQTLDDIVHHCAPGGFK